MNRLRPSLALTVLLWPLALLAQDRSAPSWIDRLHLTATGTASWVNNLSRTSYAPTRRDAAIYQAELSGTIPRQLAPGWLLVGSGAVSALTVPDFTLADEVAFSIRADLQRKFGLGPLAPVLSAHVGARYRRTKLDDSRGWTMDGGVQLAKRLLPNLRATASADWLEQDGAQQTFDVSQHSLSAELQWDISEEWTLTGGASRLHGDIVANAAWSVWEQAITGGLGPVVRDYYTSRPWWTTDLYGPGWVSYNVEANVDLWWAALAYRCSDRTSLELRRSGAYVVNHIGIAYPTDSWSLSVSHRF